MNWKHRISDFAWVTLISVLIWLYAEGRNVQTTAFETLPLTVSLASKDLILMPPVPTSVRLRFKGATAELDKLKQELSRGGIDLTLDDVTEPGERSIVLADVLPGAKPIRRVSVNIVDIDPPTFQLRVDRMVTQNVNVTFKPNDVQLVGGAAQIKPAQVAITMPESKLKQISDALVLEAIPAVSLKTLPPGVEHTMAAQVKLPTVLAGDPTVKLEPANVQLTFTIDKKEDAVVLPSVPVFVEMPPAEQENFKVIPADDSQVLKDVKVTGPAELIQQVRDGQIRVVASLRLFRDELDKGVGVESTAAVKFDVPTGLIIDSPVTTVRYTVQKRTPAP